MTIPQNCETPYYAPGKSIDDRYQLEEFIGAGGMACVYKAVEFGNPHHYAIKFLKPEYHNQEYLIKFFEQEADNMTKLAHPNIVRFYRFVRHPEYSYIVMDYIEGYSLTEIIRSMYAQNRYIPLDEVMRIMVQVARALDAIHRERFVHRDIKPSNIMISTADGSKGKAFLGDLGITGEFDKEIIGAGTVAYMAPEQHGRGLVDHRADIYAFGIVFFELIARRRPFEVEKNPDAELNLIQRKREGIVPNITDFRADLPVELNAIMQKVLAPQPEKRYNSVLEFSRAVHEVLKPQLSPELLDFNTINFLKTNPSSSTSQPAVMTEIPTKKKRNEAVNHVSIPILALGISVVALALIVFFFLGQQLTGSIPPADTPFAGISEVGTPEIVAITGETTATSTLTHTPTLTLTSTATETLTDTPTLTPTASYTPTFTNTPTPTFTLTHTHTPTFTMTPSPTSSSVPDTPVVVNAPESPRYLLASDASALVIGTDNDQMVIPANGQPVYLRVGNVEEVELRLILAESTGIEHYGILFAVQSGQEFYRFTLTLASGAWQIERVNIPDNDQTIVETGILGSADKTLQLTLQDNTVVVAVGGNLLEYTADESLSGSLALFARGADNASLILESLMLYLIGDAAEVALTASPTPAGFTTRDLLLLDIQALLATGQSGTFAINCDQYRAIFEYIDEAYKAITDAELKSAIDQILLDGQGIYTRCVTEGVAILEFISGVQDYNTWKDSLQAVRDALNP